MNALTYYLTYVCIRINFFICYLYFKELAFRLKLASVTSTSGASPSILCLAADNQVDYDGWIHSIAHISQNTNTEKVIVLSIGIQVYVMANVESSLRLELSHSTLASNLGLMLSQVKNS